MKNNLQNQTPPPNTDAVPVADTGLADESTLPAALATCAADALILPTRADLNSFWPEGIKNFQPRKSWMELCECLAYCQPTPALN